MMMLVTGGASSGKSAFAESAALELPGPHYYLAAMKPFGEEGERRIARHRALRAGKGFMTVECYQGLGDLGARFASGGTSLDAVPFDANGTALLECLGNVVANELFTDEGDQVDADTALRAVLDGLAHVEGLFGNVVVVGDEVGGDGIAYDHATETYRRVLGTAACMLAQRCDTVVECIAGQPLICKKGNRFLRISS